MRATIARLLEQGTLSGPTSRVLARAHASFAKRAIARPLRYEPGLFVVTVGGATLGGSGKTRVALACVLELARRGANVVLIGHRYGASGGRGDARVVTPDNRLADVGDEALACSRSLAASSASAHRARVVVGPSRQAALDFAMTLAPRPDAIVIDGPLQLAPERSSLALLALDARSPWGAGDVAPAGDLRAPREALLAHADFVVPVDAGDPSLVSFAAKLTKDGSKPGLFTAIARPERLVRALAEVGIVPDVHVRVGDHGPLTPRATHLIRSSSSSGARVDIWLATTKCALHLEGLEMTRPLAILDGSLVLPRAIVDAFAHRVGDAPTCMP